MRLVATSDWHGSLPDAVPAGDVLVIAGDTLSLEHDVEDQEAQFTGELVPFLAELPHRILLVAGNHDFLFAAPRPWQDELPANVTYLLDQAIEVDGVRFWGAPWSSLLPGWVFMEPETALERRWEAIPAGIDVLVVHGPPYRSLDQTAPSSGSIHVGSPSLRDWITRYEPQAVVCGHIHECFGVDRIGSTTIYNVSYLDQAYEHVPGRGPVVIEIEPTSTNGS
jgi:Icc-related predicted phosphoesterase